MLNLSSNGSKNLPKMGFEIKIICLLDYFRLTELNQLNNRTLGQLKSP